MVAGVGLDEGGPVGELGGAGLRDGLEGEEGWEGVVWGEDESGLRGGGC